MVEKSREPKSAIGSLDSADEVSSGGGLRNLLFGSGIAFCVEGAVAFFWGNQLMNKFIVWKLSNHYADFLTNHPHFDMQSVIPKDLITPIPELYIGAGIVFFALAFLLRDDRAINEQPFIG